MDSTWAPPLMSAPPPERSRRVSQRSGDPSPMSESSVTPANPRTAPNRPARRSARHDAMWGLRNNT